MAASDDPFIADLILWRFAGAAVWHSGLFALGAALWHLAAAPGSPLPWRVLSLPSWLHMAALYLTSLLVLYAQRRLLSSSDVPPVHAPQIGLTSRTWVGLVASRCVLRNRRLSDLGDVLALYGACVASGCCGVGALAWGAAAQGGEEAEAGVQWKAKAG